MFSLRKFAACVVLAVTGCTNQTAPSSPSLPTPAKPSTHMAVPEITSASEEGGFVDLVLSVQSASPDSSGAWVVHAVGTHKGKAVGLRVIFSPIKGQAIRYESVGPESDTLLAATASLYQVSLSKPAFTRGTSASAVALEGDLTKIQTQSLKFKVFFNDDDQSGESYAELYTNVDLPAGRLELFEKDPEYRENVIKALAVDP